MKNKAKILSIVAISFFIGLIAGYTLSNKKNAEHSNTQGAASEYSAGPSVGSKIDSQIQLLESNGNKKTLADYKGKSLMINFWASWCGPCLVEMPALFEIQKKYQAKGFQILAINLDDDIKDGVAILDKKFHGVPFPIFQGMKSSILKTFPVEGVPYTVLVDKAGNIQFSEAGEVDWLEQENLEKIEKIL